MNSSQVIIVTGAAGGLGRTLCRVLLETGAHIVGTAFSEEDAHTLRAELDAPDGLDIVVADVTDEADRARVFARAEELGPVWGLVNLVGGYTGGTSVRELDEEVLERMWTLNVRTAFFCTRDALGRFREQGAGGRVVNISSAAADRAPEGHFPYAAAKAAVLSLTEAAADEAKSYGVTVNALQPGMIATPANREAMPDADQSTWVTPEQVSAVVSFLLSDDASGVNGAAIRVTGRG